MPHPLQQDLFHLDAAWTLDNKNVKTILGYSSVCWYSYVTPDLGVMKSFSCVISLYDPMRIKNGHILYEQRRTMKLCLRETNNEQ